MGDGAFLESAKVAEPGEPGGDGGGEEESPVFSAKDGEVELFTGGGEHEGEDEDEGDPDEKGGVAGDVFDTLFGEDGGEASEEGGEEGPDFVVHCKLGRGGAKFDAEVSC